MSYCIYMPTDKDGNENKIFKEALEATNDREIAKIVWAISQDDELLETFNLNEKELSFVNIVDNINLRDYISDSKYSSILNYKLGYNKKRFNTLREALRECYNFIEYNSEFVPTVVKEGDKYIVKIEPKTLSSESTLEKQISLSELNDNLIIYLNSLGFDISFDDVDESIFDPMNAKENANNLKTIISIAKGKKQDIDIPEEVAHFLSVAFQDHPIAKRLYGSMTMDVAKMILGDQYDSYVEKYKNNENPNYSIRLEAIGKLIAQHIVDRSNINEDIKYISNKYLNVLAKTLASGEESDIDTIVKQSDLLAKQFVDDIFENNDSLDYFTPERLNHIEKMYSVEDDLNKLSEAVNDILATYAKRIKLLSLKEEQGKITQDQRKLYYKLKKLIEEKEHAQMCIEYLNYCEKDCDKLLKSLKASKDKFDELGDVTSPGELRRIFKNILDIQNIVSAYAKTVDDLSVIKSDLNNDLSEEDLNAINEIANKISGKLFELNRLGKDLQITSLVKLFKPYIKEGVDINIEDVLQSSLGDITGFTRFTQAMCDVTDPLLQLVDMLYKDQTNQRDNRIFEIQQQLGLIQQQLIQDTGSRNSSFIYERNEENNPTGMIKSDRDYSAFHKEKVRVRKEIEEEVKEEFRRKGKDGDKAIYDVISKKLKDWENANTEEVNILDEVKRITGSSNVRNAKKGWTERMPRKDLYPSRSLETMNASQRKYYNDWLKLKAELDFLLPSRYTKLFRAPQKKVDLKDSVLHGANIAKTAKRYRDKFIDSIDDIEFGDDGLDKNGKYTILDIAGNPIKRVPVYYNTWLGKEMDLLDTNATDVMMSYAAMAINYSEMSAIADALEVLMLQFKNRQYKQVVDHRRQYDRFKIDGDPFEKVLTEGGEATQAFKKVRNYIDKNVYGKAKSIEKFRIGNVEINAGKSADVLKEYATHIGLGFNAFSATTNASMGMLQNILIAIGYDLFGNTPLDGIKNLIAATNEYNSLVAGNVMETYSDVKSNKLSLIIQKFDVLEEYFRETGETDFNNDLSKKVVGKFNPLIGMSMGEHFLHCIPAIAILKAQKVLVDGVETSLYDALEVADSEIEMADGSKKNIKKLSVKQGTTKLDGTKFTDNDFFSVKLLIQEASHKAHGAYGDVDKGDAHRYALGRLLMQFRQWMPAFYYNRFHEERINLKTGKKEEGYYRTAVKFLIGSYKDKEMRKFNIVGNWKKLTRTQKSAVVQAMSEISALYIIMMLISMMGKPDKDDPWYLNLLKYNLYRLRTELGGAAPTSIEFLNSIKTLFKTPMPVINNMDTLFDLFRLSDLGRTIQSGKYKGWNRYGRTVYKTMPYANNIADFIDMILGDVDKFKPYMNN